MALRSPKRGANQQQFDGGLIGLFAITGGRGIEGADFLQRGESPLNRAKRGATRHEERQGERQEDWA